VYAVRYFKNVNIHTSIYSTKFQEHACLCVYKGNFTPNRLFSLQMTRTAEKATSMYMLARKPLASDGSRETHADTELEPMQSSLPRADTVSDGRVLMGDG
jgi:hypothetical protein